MTVSTVPFRVLVTGSRTWTDWASLSTALSDLRVEHGRCLVVVHGACSEGADHLADLWARSTGTRVQRFPANWIRYGRAAGPIRNAAMVNTRPNLCLAFVRNQSPGTTDCVDRVHAVGIPVRIYRVGV
jgi:hypothetical protein